MAKSVTSMDSHIDLEIPSQSSFSKNGTQILNKTSMIRKRIAEQSVHWGETEKEKVEMR